VLLCGASALAHAAHTDFQLRFLQLDTVAPYQVVNTVGSTGSDRFNDGNPLTGMVYQPLFNGGPNGATQAGGYGATTFTAGAETPGAAGDFLGSQFGVGSLAFRSGDATVNTNNLTPAGTVSTSLSLAPSAPPGTAFGLVGSTSGFGVNSVWNYAALQPGESVQITLAGSGGSNYVDRLQLRYGTNYATGQAFISFEQQTRSNFPAAPVFTRTTLATMTPQALYADLSAVDYIGLQLQRDMPTTANANPTVRATVTLYDAAVSATGGLQPLASSTFAVEGSTFQGSGAFQTVFVAGGWLDAAAPVPEPTSAALTLLGLAALGAWARRRPA
jgi:MYXO-CTERM domain-containing protein